MSSPKSSSESLELKTDVICCWGEVVENGNGMSSLDGTADNPRRFAVTIAIPLVVRSTGASGATSA